MGTSKSLFSVHDFFCFSFFLFRLWFGCCSWRQTWFIVFVCLYVKFARYCKCCAPFDVCRFVCVYACASKQSSGRTNERAHIYKFYGYFFAHVLTIDIPPQKTGTNDIIAFNNNSSSNTNTVWCAGVRACMYGETDMYDMSHGEHVYGSEHIHINID